MKRNIRLKAAIWEQYGNQREFCRKTGVSQFILSRIINGRLVPNSKERTKISKALNFPEKELFPA